MHGSDPGTTAAVAWLLPESKAKGHKRRALPTCRRR
jgi:hypothetical protein